MPNCQGCKAEIKRQKAESKRQIKTKKALEHTWTSDIRLTSKMLAGEIPIPHRSDRCRICKKARKQRGKYRKQCQLRFKN